MIVLVLAVSAYWTIYPSMMPKSEHPGDILAYASCSMSNAVALDDGRSDPATIARAVAAKCGVAYQRWLAIVTAGGKSQGVPTNFDMALFDVEMNRRSRAQKSN